MRKAPRRDPELIIFFVMLWLSAAFSVLTASAAWSAPMSELLRVMQSDGDALELRNFKATLIDENLRALYQTITMIESAAPGTRAGLLTFQWRNDLSGMATALAIIEAHHRGVDFPVVVDAIDLKTSADWALVAAMVTEGVPVWLYRPPLKDPMRALKRMHEKALWVSLSDGRVLFLAGGRNKSNHYYLGEDVYDVDLLLELDAVQGKALYSKQFDPIHQSGLIVKAGIPRWYKETQHLKQMQDMRESAELAKFFFANNMPRVPAHRQVDVSWAMFVRNREGKASVTRTVEAVVEGATERVTFANAYFIPRRDFTKTIKAKLAAGVEFVGYTNSALSTSHTNVIHLMESEVSELLPAGLNLMLRNNGELHAKATTNGSFIVVGSANLDPRSEFDDTQNGIVLESKELSEHFEKGLARQSSAGRFDYAGHHFKRFRPFDWCMRLMLKPLKGFF